MSPPRRKPAEFALPAGCRLLLAEDNFDTRRLLSIVLGKAGAEVVGVDNGQAALDGSLEAIRAGRPFDAVVLDMAMPIVDGYAAAARLRQQGYLGPIVALTAHVLPGEREKCLRAGCDEYLNKPVDRDALVTMLGQRIAQFRSFGGLLVSAEAAPEPAPAEPNPAKPKTLLESLPPKERARLLADFVGGLVERADQMDAALAGRNVEELIYLSHSIHGTAYLFSFPEIAQIAGRIEHELREGTPPERLSPAVARLRQLCLAAGQGSSIPQ